MESKEVWKRIFGFQVGDRVRVKVKDRRCKKGYRIDTGTVYRLWYTQNLYGRKEGKPPEPAYIVRSDRNNNLYVEVAENMEKIL